MSDIVFCSWCFKPIILEPEYFSYRLIRYFHRRCYKKVAKDMKLKEQPMIYDPIKHTIR